MTIVCSIIVYHHAVNGTQFVGLALAIGAMIYNFAGGGGGHGAPKARKVREVGGAEDAAPLLEMEGGGEADDGDRQIPDVREPASGRGAAAEDQQQPGNQTPPRATQSLPDLLVAGLTPLVSGGSPVRLPGPRLPGASPHGR